MHLANLTKLDPVTLGHLIDPQRPLLVYANRVEAAMCAEPHRHPRGQFVYARSGSTRVLADGHVHLIPQSQGFWCPPQVEHELQFPGPVAVANLFIDPAHCSELPTDCRVMDIPPLLHALIERIIDIAPGQTLSVEQTRLMQVIVDELKYLPAAPLQLPWSADKRLVPMMQALLETPDDPRSVEDWAAQLNLSSRTLVRLFHKETQLSPGQWRTQLRLLNAAEQLRRGRAITDIALSLGYATPSSFATAFKQRMGKAPSEYQSQTSTT